MVQKNLTQERLKEVLDYDPETGIFCRKNCFGLKEQKIISGSNVNGYRTIKIDNKPYYLHRLAWLYVYGKFPEKEIDHKNKNKSDNRICNLRDISRQQNIQNRGNPLGVFQTKNKRRWRARIMFSGNCINLGTFATKEEAIEKYQEAKKIYHPYFYE
jgi:hypothetical protein